VGQASCLRSSTTETVVPRLIQLTYLENQKDALEGYARDQLKYISLKNDVEFMQLHPEYYESPVEIGILNEWNEFFAGKISELKKQASRCANNSGDCGIIGFKLPENFSEFYAAQRQRTGKTQDFSRANEYIREVLKKMF
jgi:hypothetical protein